MVNYYLPLSLITILIFGGAFIPGEIVNPKINKFYSKNKYFPP
jgi:hypothetical protein